MDTNALSQIRDLIARSNNVAIVVSANPSVDQMAGALALSLSMNAQNKKAYVISPTNALVEHSSLVGIDRVKGPGEGGNGDLVVSFPYREGEIDKVSYTIDGDSLNIVVKAGEKGLTFQESDVQFKRGADKPDMVISVGVASLAQLSAIFPEDVLSSVTLLNIDNVSTNEGYGNVVLVSAKFSSLSEQVADLLLNLGMELDIDVAQNLMIGLTDATSNFQDTKTSYLAFEIASILIKRGAVRKTTGPRQSFQNQRPSQPAPRNDRPFNDVRQQSQPRSDQSSRSPQSQQPRRDDRRENIREALRQHVRGGSSQMASSSQSQNQPSMSAGRVGSDRSLGESINMSQRPSNQSIPRVQHPEPTVSQEPVVDMPTEDTQSTPPSDWLTPKVYKGSSTVS